MPDEDFEIARLKDIGIRIVWQSSSVFTAFMLAGYLFGQDTIFSVELPWIWAVAFVCLLLSCAILASIYLVQEVPEPQSDDTK